MLKTGLEQSTGQLESLQAQLEAVNEQIAALKSAGDSGEESSGKKVQIMLPRKQRLLMAPKSRFYQKYRLQMIL